MHDAAQVHFLCIIRNCIVPLSPVVLSLSSRLGGIGIEHLLSSRSVPPQHR
jgi:hypothetical protein